MDGKLVVSNKQEIKLAGLSDGRGGAGKYANGFNDDNETYRNEDREGIPVRIGSNPMNTSVVGWE
jgi:hypothetical protein